MDIFGWIASQLPRRLLLFLGIRMEPTLIRSHDGPQTFLCTSGLPIDTGVDLDRLRLEHILQRDRDVWVTQRFHPFLAIDISLVRSRMTGLDQFAVFSSATLFQNLRPSDLGGRLIGSLFGYGSDAGLTLGSRALVEGRANAKARFLYNWNPPLAIGTTPFVAEGTSYIFVDGLNIFQRTIGELITVAGYSRPTSKHYDFTALVDLRNTYYRDFHSSHEATAAQVAELNQLLERVFVLNRQSLEAAASHHANSPVDSIVDYEAPALTKYDRPTHDSGGAPKVEVVFALLHYEKAIREFNSLKVEKAAGKIDEAFVHGVYGAVAAAACIEAIANRLVFAQTGVHPDPRDRRTPLAKINESCAAIAAQSGSTFAGFVVGDPIFDALEELRVLRNGFMHAKENPGDIDAQSLAPAMHRAVGEASCRYYLENVRLAADKIFSQLPSLRPPIVTKKGPIWMGDLEVP